MRLLLFSILLIILAACTTHKQTVQVPVELHGIQYVYDVKLRDRIIVDSVSRWVLNDTVYIYKERLNLLNISDTLIRKDSIPTAVRLESTDEISIEYLDKLGELKSLMFKLLLP